MLPLGERDASVVRTRQKSSAIIAALGEICGLAAQTILVRDLHTFDLPPDSTELIVSEP